MRNRNFTNGGSLTNLHPISRNRGFTFLGMLMALMIIAILVGSQWTGTDETPPMQQMAMDRSHAASCNINRSTAKTQMTMWGLNNPGKVPTVEDLNKANLSIGRCTEGGHWTILPNGHIHCTKHDPPIVNVIYQQYPGAQADPIIKAERIQDVLRVHYPDSEHLQ